VVLAACHAAHAFPSLHEPAGLPSAFLEAGARAVIAVTVEIPDLEAARFFDAVRERIRAGVAPAAALRDVRMSTQVTSKDDWRRGVLIFE
jgi:CHAT domain-containing protein